MGSSFEKAKDAIVNYVNPKLKSFDKPLQLSLLIGGFTGAIVIGLTVMFTSQCESNIALTTATFDTFQDQEMKSPGYTCVISTKFQQTRMGPCYDLMKPEAGHTVLQDIHTGGSGSIEIDYVDQCFVNYLAPCTFKGGYQSLPEPVITYCPESEMFGKKQGEVMKKDSEGNPSQLLENCAYQNLQEQWVLADKQIIISYKTCPTVGASLGAALGYAAYIELVFTIIFVSVLMKIGCIKTSQIGKLKDILKDLVKEDDVESGTSTK